MFEFVASHLKTIAIAAATSAVMTVAVHITINYVLPPPPPKIPRAWLRAPAMKPFNALQGADKTIREFRF